MLVRKPEKLIRVACFATPRAHASALYGGFDILSATNRFHVPDNEPNVGFEPIIVSADGKDVTGWHGRRIIVDASIHDVGKVDAIYIPAIGDVNEVPAPQPHRVIEWLQMNYDENSIIAAACSGGCLLAEAGLLVGEKATTHWAWVNEFRELYPDVVLHERRALVFSGPGHRIITAGGGSLWTDLMLYLVSRHLGHELAVQLAKFYMIDWGRNDQRVYAQLEAKRQHHDMQISAAQAAISNNLTDRNVLTLARMASNLPDRTFERRFKASSGMTPRSYVQQMRVEAAKKLLENTNLQVDSLASEVGYEDPSSFRRLFVRLVGVPPGEYRRRFGMQWKLDS